MARPRRKGMAVRRRTWVWRLAAAALVFMAGILGWGGWRGVSAVLSSDFLTLRYLEIEGCRVLPESELRERLEPLLGRPMHKVDPDSLEAQLALVPRIERVRIQRRLPGTLRCRVEETAGVALLLDGEFTELDAAGRALPRFGDPPPDLPIIRPGGSIGADSLVGLALLALAALREHGFDLSREVSELAAAPEGIVYTRNEGDTRVILGWKEFDARARTYAQVFADVSGQGFPSELDLRYRDQVVAR